MKIRVISVFIAVLMAFLITACSSSPGSGGGNSSSSKSSSSASSSVSPGAAIGWIGGGVNGWQTGIAPASASDYQSFSLPRSVCVDSSGNIYVVDMNNNRICKWNASGTAIGWIGGGTNGWQTGSAPAIGPTDYQSFRDPGGVCVDSSGNIYVADCNDHRICKWNSNGVAIGWIGGGLSGWQTNFAPNHGTGYQYFYNPIGICLDSSGNIYVADTANNRVCKWNTNGTAIGWIGGGVSGWQTGNAPASGAQDYQSFFKPEDVFVDSSGNIYVADTYNYRICRWNSPGVAQGWIGGATNGWQTGAAPGTTNDYQSFDFPVGIYLDSSGNIYVADMANNRVCKWNTNGTAIGWIGGGVSGWQTGKAPAPGTNYQSFYEPQSVYLDSSGNIYVADEINSRISKWH